MKFIDNLVESYISGIQRRKAEDWFYSLPMNGNTMSDPLPPYSWGRPRGLNGIVYDLGHSSGDERLLRKVES